MAVGGWLLVILLSQGAVAAAADVTVLASGAIRHALRDVFSDFERATGHKVLPHYEGGLVSRRQMDAGDGFDVAIVSFDVDDLARLGRIAPGTRVVLGHTRVGVGVRKGAPKPDIGTAEAVKRTLLAARSVAYPREALVSGVHFLGLLDRLGIAQADDVAPLRRAEGSGPGHEPARRTDHLVRAQHYRARGRRHLGDGPHRREKERRIPMKRSHFKRGLFLICS